MGPAFLPTRSAALPDRKRANALTGCLALLCTVLMALLLFGRRPPAPPAARPGGHRQDIANYVADPVLISYSYFEEDEIQVGIFWRPSPLLWQGCWAGTQHCNNSFTKQKNASYGEHAAGCSAVHRMPANRASPTSACATTPRAQCPTFKWVETTATVAVTDAGWCFTTLSSQRSNFEHFLEVGTQFPLQHRLLHWVFVVAGELCTPCAPLEAMLAEEAQEPQLARLGIRASRTSSKVSLLRRSENVGLDLAGHNISIEYMAFKKRLAAYKCAPSRGWARPANSAGSPGRRGCWLPLGQRRRRARRSKAGMQQRQATPRAARCGRPTTGHCHRRFFLLLNSSAKGPFAPAYMPPGWHWTHAYLARFGSGIHAVGASLVCLPADDAGAPSRVAGRGAGPATSASAWQRRRSSQRRQHGCRTAAQLGPRPPCAGPPHRPHRLLQQQGLALALALRFCALEGPAPTPPPPTTLPFRRPWPAAGVMGARTGPPRPAGSAEGGRTLQPRLQAVHGRARRGRGRRVRADASAAGRRLQRGHAHVTVGGAGREKGGRALQL
jgi:hypothetical protein